MMMLWSDLLVAIGIAICGVGMIFVALMLVRTFDKKNNCESAKDACGEERPPRDVLCQLPKGHGKRHCAVIFWE